MRIRYIRAITETGYTYLGVCVGSESANHDELTALGNDWIVSLPDEKPEFWPPSVTWITSITEIDKHEIPLEQRVEILEKALSRAHR